jgi:PHP family Zn ribbon phosphoesterase
MIPLGEVIAKLYRVSSPGTKKCRALYMKLVSAFGNEIAVLTGVPVSDIGEIDPGVAGAIDALRNGRVRLVPGGGGRYGSFSLVENSG